MRYLILTSLLLIWCALAFATEGKRYTVQKGDTLVKIARAQLGDESKWKQIATLNGLTKPFALNEGQILILSEDSNEVVLPTKIKKPNVEVNQDTQSTLSTDLKEETEDDDEFSLGVLPWEVIIISTLAFLLISLVFLSISIRIGCWFSLVETTIMKSFYLSLVLAGLNIAATVGLGFLLYLAKNNYASKESSTILSLIIVVFLNLFSFVAIKRILECKARSVITVMIMTCTIGYLGSFLIILILANFFSNLINFEQIKTALQTVF